MDSMIYILFICIMVPLLMMIPLLKGEAKLVMAFMLNGGLWCVLCAKEEKLFFTGTYALFVMAAIYHSIFNTLVQSETYKYWGVVLPFVTYAFFTGLQLKKYSAASGLKSADASVPAKAD